MEAKPSGRSEFPFYLKPGLDVALLQWVGKWIQEKRSKKTAAQVAKAAKVSPEEIERIEQGFFYLNLGQLRQILRHGYGCGLEDLLAECYEAHRERFDPKHKRRFARDYHYSFCRNIDSNKQPTPVLIGGDPENFLWAVPFRKLKRQPIVTELLELAPARKKKTSGVTAENFHDGVEIVYVIHGSIEVSIEGGSDGPYTRKLTHEDLIHFNAGFTHQIKNDGNTTSALMLIVRSPALAPKKQEERN